MFETLDDLYVAYVSMYLMNFNYHYNKSTKLNSNDELFSCLSQLHS